MQHGKKLLESHRKALLGASANKITRSATTIGSGHQARHGSDGGGRETPDVGSIGSNGSAAAESHRPSTAVDNALASHSTARSCSERPGLSNGRAKGSFIDTSSSDRKPVSVESRERSEVIVMPHVQMPSTNSRSVRQPVDTCDGSAQINNVSQMADVISNKRTSRKEHMRSSSTDRLLDTALEFSSRNGKARSSSSDRILDACSKRLSSSDESNGYETSTIRRSSKQSDAYVGEEDSGFRTLDSTGMGTCRRNSNVTTATPNKMIARLPITTSVTRQMSMQQPYDVRTLPRKNRSRAAAADCSNDSFSNDYDGGYQTIRHSDVSSLQYKNEKSFNNNTNFERTTSSASQRSSIRWSSDISSLDVDSNSESSSVHYAESRLSQFPSTVNERAVTQCSNTLVRNSGAMNCSRKSAVNSVPPAALETNYGLHKYPSMELPPPPVDAKPGGVETRCVRADRFDPPPCPVQNSSLPRPASPDTLPPPPEFLLAFPRSRVGKTRRAKGLKEVLKKT